MIDSLHKMGSVTLATKATAAYTADYLDLGAIASASGLTLKTLPEMFICFQIDGDPCPATDYIDPAFQTADDTGFSTNLETTAFPSSATGLATGTILRYRVPMQCRRYVRGKVTPQSSGTYDANTCIVWLEAGAQEQTK